MNPGPVITPSYCYRYTVCIWLDWSHIAETTGVQYCTGPICCSLYLITKHADGQPLDTLRITTSKVRRCRLVKKAFAPSTAFVRGAEEVPRNGDTSHLRALGQGNNVRYIMYHMESRGMVDFLPWAPLYLTLLDISSTLLIWRKNSIPKSEVGEKLGESSHSVVSSSEPLKFISWTSIRAINSSSNKHHQDRRVRCLDNGKSVFS